MSTVTRTSHGVPRVETVALGALGVGVVLFGAFTVLRPAAAVAYLVESVGYATIYALAAAVLMLRARSDVETAIAWRWLALAMGILAVSRGWHSISEFIAGSAGSYSAGLPAVLGLAAYIPLIIGSAGLIRRWLPSSGGASVIDTALVASGLYALCVLLSSVTMSADATLDLFRFGVNAATLLFDFVLIAIAIGASQSSHWRPQRAIQLLLAATACFAITDAVNAVQFLHESSMSEGLLEVGWPIGVLLLGLAARASADVRTVQFGRNPYTTVPAVMIIVAGAVLTVSSEGPLAWLARLAGAITVLLAVLRMDGAVRWAIALGEQLQVARADALTGLPNRRALQAMEPSRVAGCAFVAVDLDGLGEINARFGTQTGDHVLVQAAERLKAAVRDGDVVARIGGDDFGVLLTGVGPTDAARIAEKLVAALEDEVSADAVSLRVSACAGVSTAAADGADAEQLMAEAESALKDAKRLGSGLVRSYAGGTGERSQDRLRVRAEIRESFRQGGEEFVPYFHPITSVADGSIFAVESLVRWHHDGKVWSPGAFIPEVEQSGSMPALTEHMIRASLRQLREAGLQCPTTVNVPPDLVDTPLIGIVHDALAASGSRPEQLIVEITEDAIMRNPALAATVLRELRESGVRVLLDDFGTGWSGLSSLRDLVVDGLKMDGSFINGIITDFTTNSIVRSVAELAERLGVLVIYEGVEEPALLAEVDTFANGYIQGFAISRPMPIAELSRWVRVRAIQELSKQAGDRDAPARAIW